MNNSVINDVFIQLKDCYGDRYFEKLKKLEYLDVNSYVIKSLIKLIDENINNNELAIILDIFLELKYLNKFSEKDLSCLNEKIVYIFNKSKNENIAYYLLGYVINNKLDYDKKRFKEDFIAIDEEYKLGNIISEYVIEDKPHKEEAIMSLVGGFDSGELEFNNVSLNIFKVCEVIRATLNNDIYKKKLNDTLYNILNICDKSTNGIDNILEFIIAIYQDKTFRNQDVIIKMNEFINKSTSIYLEKLYIDICSSYKINRINCENKYIDNAARGTVANQDLDILNGYLNRTIKTNKKVNLDLKYGYDAYEVIKHAEINIDEKIDLEVLIKKLKIQYYEENNLNSQVAGYSFKLRKYNKASIIINKNYEGTYERNRFTIAHEIGHIFSKSKNKDFSTDYIFKKTQCDLNEREANNFAGELLLPKPIVDEFNKKDITYERIEKLAQKYEVSIEMACNRIVKASEGLFIFIVMYDNKIEYIIKSKGYYNKDNKLNDNKLNEFEEYLKDIYNIQRNKYYKDFNYKVDVEIKGIYKYIIINDKNSNYRFY